MDGYKIRAKLSLHFPKAVVSTEAEEVMMQYARAFAAAVECELSNGDLPFDERELHGRLTEKVTALPKKNVNLIGLHVWHKGAVSSGSMLAVKPDGRHSSPTVPAMQAVSQTRQRTETSAAIHAATTVKPPDVPESVRDERSVSSQPLSQPLSVQPASSRSMPSPAQRQSTPGATRPAIPAAAARANAVVTKPAPAASRPIPAPPGVGSGPLPAAARMASGVVPAVEPRILRAKSGFLVAIETCSGKSGEEVGRALAQPVRDAAAGVLFATLDALNAGLGDPLGLLDGRVAVEVRQGLIGEACVCVCYLLYDSLTRTRLPQMLAIEVVQSACTQALMDKAMPVSEISRYLATESPREEFSGRVCSLLGVRETSELQQRIEAALRALRIDARSCAEQIERRLSQGKAASGQ